MTPKFIGVSTGRVGSKYTARVFESSGIPTTHETVYTAHHLEDGLPDWTRPELGEWSAQVVPFLDDFDGVVFHQVRHPLKVIASYLDFGLFHNPARHGAEGLFMARHANITGEDPIGEASRFYWEWNRLCEAHATKRWRVEEVSIDTIQEAAEMVGAEVHAAQIREVLADTPKDMNTRARDNSVDWSDIPDDWRPRVENMAERYGY